MGQSHSTEQARASSEFPVDAGWETLSTEDFCRQTRVDRWNRFGSETFCDMTVDPDARVDFKASISRIGFGQMGMAQVRATAARASSQGGRSSGWAAPGNDALLFVVAQSGQCFSEQDHKTAVLDPGDLFVRDLARPWVHRSTAEMEILNLKVPYELLQSRIDDPSRLVGQVLSSHHAEVAISVDLIRSAHFTLSRSEPGPWQNNLANLILDSIQMLYQLAANSSPFRNELRMTSSLRRDAMNYICSHIGDPDLTVAQVAEAFGVSTRQLQRAFLVSGDTPSAFIQLQRLDRAANMLDGRFHCSDRTVTAVAFELGFNEVSHFSRLFARRFGVPPSRYRGTAPLKS